MLEIWTKIEEEAADEWIKRCCNEKYRRSKRDSWSFLPAKRAIDALFTYRTEHDDFVLDEAQLTNILKDAMNALQDGDMVLLADILQYDYLEYMEELVGNME